MEFVVLPVNVTWFDPDDENSFALTGILIIHVGALSTLWNGADILDNRVYLLYKHRDAVSDEEDFYICTEEERFEVNSVVTDPKEGRRYFSNVWDALMSDKDVPLFVKEMSRPKWAVYQVQSSTEMTPQAPLRMDDISDLVHKRSHVPPAIHKRIRDSLACWCGDKCHICGQTVIAAKSSRCCAGRGIDRYSCSQLFTQFYRNPKSSGTKLRTVYYPKRFQEKVDALFVTLPAE